MLGVSDLRILADINHTHTALAHRLEHPDDIVGVGLDAEGEVELTTAALWTGHDEQVGKAFAVHTEEGLDTLGLPLLAQRAAAATGDHVEGRGRHPLKAGCIDQDIERVFSAVVNHAPLVDAADPKRRGIHQRHMRQVEGRQELIMKGRPLAAIGVIRLERRRGFRVFDDGIHPRTDLLHDPEIGVELLGDHLLRRERALVLFAFLEVGDLARQKVIIALQRGAPRRDHCQPVAARPRPAGLLRPGLDLLRRGGPLIAHIDG